MIGFFDGFYLLTHLLSYFVSLIWCHLVKVVLKFIHYAVAAHIVCRYAHKQKGETLNVLFNKQIHLVGI